LAALNRYAEAVSSYEQALALKAEYPDVLCNLGIARQALKHFDQALDCFNAAIVCKADYAEVYSNRGILRLQLKQYEQAVSDCQIAIELKPEFLSGYTNLGVALGELKRFAEALIIYEQSLEIDPDFACAWWNKGLLKILLGDFAEGWALYEWGWVAGQRGTPRNFSKPLWLGDAPLAGKTLLIHVEQGLGDVIQFCRYVQPLAELAGQVILEVPKPLLRLCATLKTRLTLVEAGQLLENFDYYCPIMSLPLAFKTTLDNIPAETPYLYAEPEKQAHWQRELATSAKLKVGLVWSGAAQHKNDHNRSIPFQLLTPLLALPLEFHVLQKEFRAADQPLLESYANLHLHVDQLADFADTAALLAAVDLVISVDTSVAHLAGALGKPVWILLPYIPDYRWLLDRNDTPWYPTAKLFRQGEDREWSTVIRAVQQALTNRFLRG
jgi:tetratricopeptide (TPR) repeat protein